MTDTSILATSPPLVAVTGTAIVSAPTTVAPLTAADGITYVVQVMVPGNGTVVPVNAHSWTHNTDGSLDLYDGNSMLVASFPTGQWVNVQLVPGS